MSIFSEDLHTTSLAEVRKRQGGDHQVVVVGTDDGRFTQMDLSASGTMLRYGVERNHYSAVEVSLKPKPGLRLHTVFHRFREVTHARGFDFQDYNCIRFASDLAGTIGASDGDVF